MPNGTFLSEYLHTVYVSNDCHRRSAGVSVDTAGERRGIIDEMDGSSSESHYGA